ncbi:SWIB/MDM2 domain-containing protein [Sphingosinicella sp. LHD-64]|uniref:SWIB/MDM2 domain-containing protein n=1 Tax=Sphingosinicella sp. LHD-64 TaxID=3072139 RepID=UPI0028102E5E|nr:SWIB/MDM2 domain-containing protein [Sphingosinicella sp. LHD-64]MDQ8757942.1 SWIB/MDM2 domain-containing protein [Sphingosinicella sp. LHD-64]
MANDRAARFIASSRKGVRIDNSGATGEPLLGKRHSAKAASGLTRPVRPSDDLAVITGGAALPRSQVVSKVWDHIKKNNLQNPKNKREILADDKLKKIFGKDKVSMFEMNKHLSRHLS